jgi:hypothetical protein
MLEATALPAPPTKGMTVDKSKGKSLAITEICQSDVQIGPFSDKVST